MQYFYLAGQLAQTSCAGEARAMYGKALLGYSRRFWRHNFYENTGTPGRYRSTNDSVMKSERSSLVRGSDLPNSAHTSVGDMWRGPPRSRRVRLGALSVWYSDDIVIPKRVRVAGI